MRKEQVITTNNNQMEEKGAFFHTLKGDGHSKNASGKARLTSTTGIA